LSGPLGDCPLGTVNILSNHLRTAAIPLKFNGASPKRLILTAEMILSACMGQAQRLGGRARCSEPFGYGPQGAIPERATDKR